MKFSTIFLMFAAFVALTVVLSGTVSAQPLVNRAGRGCNASTQPFILAQSDYGGDFDLNYCQQECRMRYGPLGAELIVILAVDQHDRQRRRPLPEFEPGARFVLPLIYRQQL
jgi:hypothetical protein